MTTTLSLHDLLNETQVKLAATQAAKAIRLAAYYARALRASLPEETEA